MTKSNNEGRKREGNKYYHEQCVKVSKRCASAADGSCTPTPKGVRLSGVLAPRLREGTEIDRMAPPSSRVLSEGRKLMGTLGFM